MPGQVRQIGYGGVGYLLGHRQDQGLEQQGDVGELAEPARFGEADRAVRQLHPWRPDLKKAFVLEEVETPVALWSGFRGSGAGLGRLGRGTWFRPRS
jgi:hypothetical protein